MSSLLGCTSIGFTAGICLQYDHDWNYDQNAVETPQKASVSDDGNDHEKNERQRRPPQSDQRGFAHSLPVVR